MPTKLLIATRNNAKLQEYKDILMNYNFEILSLADLGITDEVEETGATIEENAKLKAESYVALSNLPTLADDTGMEIQALGGWPGVYSRRVWGPDEREATDEEAIAEVLSKLKTIPADRRQAQFTTVAALAIPGQKTITVTAHAPGLIAMAARGVVAPGFPYRRIFMPQGSNKTHGELAANDPAAGYLNHRKQAIIKLEPYLKQLANYA